MTEVEKQNIQFKVSGYFCRQD